MVTNPADDSDDALEEIDAMRIVASALKDLRQPARDRVLRWTLEKYGQTPAPLQVVASHREAEATRVEMRTGEATDPADLYAACQPQTDAEKTLVVSYWLQESGGVSGIDAQSVNTELKHLGHGVGNITRAFDKLIQNRPHLMIQTKKAGSTKQARKTYRVTVEGKNMVEQMRNGARLSP